MAARDMLTAFLAGAMGRRVEDMPSRALTPDQRAAIAAGFTSVADWRADIERRRKREEEQHEARLASRKLSDETIEAELFARSGLEAGETAPYAVDPATGELTRLGPKQEAQYRKGGLGAVQSVIPDFHVGDAAVSENIDPK
jgi:hypothetical protein